MQLFRIVDPTVFDGAPEHGMDFHLALTEGRTEARTEAFVVLGGRVAISLLQPQGAWTPHLLDQAWLRPALATEQREATFNEWLSGLPEAPPLSPIQDGAHLGPLILRLAEPGPTRESRDVLAFIVAQAGPLGVPPSRRGPVYGHLPFLTKTDHSTVMYRWESLPMSRRIKRTAARSFVGADTYAAPSSETPFAVTGFATVARFALPSLFPACFRWELQPVPSLIECGASVPLNGQSGGGVEVRFPSTTNNRGPIADPVFLPVM
jgi:hypothetical protein